MAYYNNGVRMATTDEEIKCLFGMAKEIFDSEKKEKIVGDQSPEERSFVSIILEGKYPNIPIKNIIDNETNSFAITEIGQNESGTAFRITGGVCLHEKYKRAAVHMLAFTYNADGPRRPVGLGDTVYAENCQGVLENVCFVRKALLDVWHLGVMITLAVMDEGNAAVVSGIVVLNEAQDAYFERMKR